MNRLISNYTDNFVHSDAVRIFGADINKNNYSPDFTMLGVYVKKYICNNQNTESIILMMTNIIKKYSSIRVLFEVDKNIIARVLSSFLRQDELADPIFVNNFLSILGTIIYNRLIVPDTKIGGLSIKYNNWTNCVSQYLQFIGPNNPHFPYALATDAIYSLNDISKLAIKMARTGVDIGGIYERKCIQREFYQDIVFENSSISDLLEFSFSSNLNTYLDYITDKVKEDIKVISSDLVPNYC